MLFNNRVPLNGIWSPVFLDNKLQFVANCLLREEEIQIFNQALQLVAWKIKEDMKNGNLSPKVEDLRRVTIIFTKNGEFSFSGIENEVGINVSLIVYKTDCLHYIDDCMFPLFTFIEEMTHHFWNIEDETLVKYKVVEIIQQEYKDFTIETAKGWHIYGL